MASELVILCVCLAGHALGLPQQDLMSPRTSEDQHEQRLAIDMSGVASQPGSPALLLSPSGDDKVEPSDIAKLPLGEDSKTKTEEKKLPSDDQYKMPLSIPTANQDKAEGEDNIRAKKSTQDIPRNRGPHTTTVCIQVRSEHQPQVVCGDPLGESQKGTDKEPLPKARFAYPSPNDYFPHTYDQQHIYLPSSLQPGYFRASPSVQDMNNLPNPISQLGPNKISPLKPTPMPGRPSAAIGSLPKSMYPSRRSQDEPIASKTGDSILPQGAGAPASQLSPQGFQPHPNGVVVHKQYYPSPPYSGYIPSHPPSPLRLNCATEGFVPYRSGPPDGYIPYLRSGLPVDERFLLSGEVARMAEVPQYIDEQQTYMMEPQARQAMQDSIVGSPYASPDGLSGTLFMDENGQTYMMSDSLARSAGEEQRMWAQDQYVGAERKDDPIDNSKKLAMDLDLANKKLSDLQKQLGLMKTKKEMEPVQKDTKKDQLDEIKIPEVDATSAISEKKTDPPKSTKRHTFRLNGD